jgi:hypothetical protein
MSHIERARIGCNCSKRHSRASLPVKRLCAFFGMVFRRALDTMNLRSYVHEKFCVLHSTERRREFLVGFAARSSFFSRSTALLCVLLPMISMFGLVVASEGVDRFWRDLGFSQDPDLLLREILSRSEFRDSDWTSLFAALIRWFLELIAELLRKIFGRWNVNIEGEMLWTAVGAFFAAVFVAGALIALFYALKSLLHRKDDRPETQSSSFVIAGQSSSEMLRMSRSMAERGEHRGALIHLFRYVLIRLDEEGRLGFYAGKTNREILRSPNLRLSDRKVLSEMVPIFNGVRYGNFPCARSEYDRFLSLTGLLVEVPEVP